MRRGGVKFGLVRSRYGQLGPEEPPALVFAQRRILSPEAFLGFASFATAGAAAVSITARSAAVNRAVCVMTDHDGRDRLIT